MDKTTTHITNVTIAQNSVVISLERFKELEKFEKEKTIYIKRNLFSTHEIITDNEVVKDLAKQLSEEIEDNQKNRNSLHVFKETNRVLQEIVDKKEEKKKYSWKEIFRIIKLKILE